MYIFVQAVHSHKVLMTVWNVRVYYKYICSDSRSIWKLIIENFYVYIVYVTRKIFLRIVDGVQRLSSVLSFKIIFQMIWISKFLKNIELFRSWVLNAYHKSQLRLQLCQWTLRLSEASILLVMRRKHRKCLLFLPLIYFRDTFSSHVYSARSCTSYLPCICYSCF